MRRRPERALIAGLGLLLATGCLAGEPAQLLGSHVLTRPGDPLFGGLSGIEVSEAGDTITLLSDRGSWTRGRLQRDAEGRIVAVDLAPMQPLKGRGEAPLERSRSDSEGLAIAADGAAYVSFEGAARVLRYRDLGGSAENLPVAPEFRRMQGNGALEALAVDAEGTLYTLPERSGGTTRPFPVYRFRDGEWDQPFSLPREDSFLPVGTDIGPDGRFYLLERQFRGLLGFASRVRRFAIDGDSLSPGETLLQTSAGTHDNLEGISVWRDAAGRLTLSLVADDNFAFFQSTQIVEYRIAD
ncbi:hypothetical protein C5F48_04410 [Cereibacter changlensis JA139]|uniref:Phytase-like domain-containing protein n=2 Tax=Cereibacter changlensis TaxID=402884 RepID=A0A2T4JYD9_9RHOB|nr:esterase-like activity of phytase family protein [Cereibacter changlensis]PTE22928.1 hypothetical protein C5F48_04410 [Cereibacter changlensis JA139]PZX58807.1 hypothetical protein LX76_00312 [Cereibacter changlensis]